MWKISKSTYIDTNFILPRMFHKREGAYETPNQLDRMLFLQDQGKLEVVVPDSVQAEIYAVLRAGRYPVRMKNGAKFHRAFPHHAIMKLAYNYREVFNLGFLDGFARIDFGIGAEYKKILFEKMKYILGMDIEQSREFIYNKTRDTGMRLSDPYDFHVMVWYQQLPHLLIKAGHPVVCLTFFSLKRVESA